MIEFVGGVATGFGLAIIMVSLQAWALEKRRRAQFDAEVARVLREGRKGLDISVGDT